jgi:hypothetical protein
MAVAAAAGVVVVLFMALPFFVESAPRAYRLKAGNAATLLFQHSSGHPPPQPLRIGKASTFLG